MIAHADQSNVYGDKTDAFTIQANENWKRLPGAENAHAANTISFVFVAKDGGKSQSCFAGSVVPAEQTIDAEVQAWVDSDKLKVPDQGGAGTIVEGKLDGEVARTVITKTIIDHIQFKRKAIIAFHRGKFFQVEFFAPEDQYDKQCNAADALFASFQWK